MMTFAPSPSIVVLALAASAHCAAMCGPLCRTLAGSTGGSTRSTPCGVPAPAPSGHARNALWGYQLGRVFGYALLGAFAALLGQTAVSHSLTWLANAVTGLVVFATLAKAWTLVRGPTFAKHTERSRLGPLFTRTARLQALVFASFRTLLSLLPLPAPFATGLSTALLPCGFLFAAFGHAAVSLDPASGAISMGVFAVATAPAVLAGAHLTQWLMAPLGADQGDRGGDRGGKACPKISFHVSPRTKQRFAAGFLVVAAALLAGTAWRGPVEPLCRSTPPLGLGAWPPSSRDSVSRPGTFRPTPREAALQARFSRERFPLSFVHPSPLGLFSSLDEHP